MKLKVRHFLYTLVIILIFINSIYIVKEIQIENKVFFPRGVLETDKRNEKLLFDSYSRSLNDLKEPSLYGQRIIHRKLTSYRFTYLRAFDNPISIRVEMESDRPVLYFKECIQIPSSDYKPEKIIINKRIELNNDEYKNLSNKFEEVNFWDIPVFDRICPLDGSSWIIEYLNNGKYHVVYRFSPESGPIKDLGMLFITMSKQKIDELY